MELINTIDGLGLVNAQGLTAQQLREKALNTLKNNKELVAVWTQAQDIVELHSLCGAGFVAASPLDGITPTMVLTRFSAGL